MDRMDPLAARLMSRIGMGAAGRAPVHSTPMVKAGIGLNPSNPLLPPVHNLGMIHLKEPLQDAEIYLHDARVELEKVQKGGSTASLAPLYTAMEKLELAERDYFARRYFGGDKAILRGWTCAKFKLKIKQLINIAYRRAMQPDLRQPSTTHDKAAKRAADIAQSVSIQLETMNNKWYVGNARQQTKPTTFGDDFTRIIDMIGFIETRLSDVLALADSNQMKQASITSVKESLRHAKICHRLALLVEDDRCDLPHDV